MPRGRGGAAPSRRDVLLATCRPAVAGGRPLAAQPNRRPGAPLSSCPRLPDVATIHHTTLTPSKLELLARWLPLQPWYRGSRSPALAKGGGFRLDDPGGEVGIEVMIITADGA